MSASEKIQRNKKVGFDDDAKKTCGRETRSRSRGRARDRRSKSVDVRSVNKDGEPRKRDRSLIGLVRQGSRKSVSSLVKLFEAGRSFYMNEGRKCQILLPDERRLDILIQPKLLTSDLLDIVASHFKLKEKDYFGLAFQDETGHYNWLQLEKKVLEHDLPRKQSSNLVIAFLVRFYVESITQLRDTATVELFYLTAKQAVFKGQIECDSETVFELASHVLQATLGDYADDATTKADLKKLPLITTSALREHPSIQFCEERVIHYYQKIAGTAKGLAIVNYMTILESLPTYGIHYFEVKDKKDIPWWLGISNKGIGVYDKNDKNVPRRVFVWKTLENLYYRDKKFSIEVHDPKRVVHTLSSFNLYEDAIRETIDETDELSDAISDPTTQVSVSRRTFGPGNVNVHAWFGATPQLTKCIWSMAVAQHQFYHERKNSRRDLAAVLVEQGGLQGSLDYLLKCGFMLNVDLQATLPSVRSVSELATELSRSTSSLPGSIGSDISRSGSSASLPSLGASRFDLNFDPADTAKVQREMFSALKARREALEEVLRKRTEELKLLCIKEGELTGCLPEETPLAPGEEPPQIRRRVGTAFSLDADIVPAGSEDDDTTKKLELELELQKQITNAAHKLASDKSVSRFVRKQRRHSFIKAQTKLKEMEKKIGDHRKGSVPNSPGSSSKYDDSEAASPAQSPLVPRGPRSNYKQHDGRPGQKDSSMHRSHTTPKDFSGEREIASMTLTPTNSSPSLEAGYKPNSVYSTQYRNQTYPTLGSRSQSQISNNSDYDNKGGSQGRLEGSQDSGFSSTNNMYNVNSRRTSRYESNQDLISPSSESHYETLDNMTDSKLNLQGGSLDNAHRKPPKNYGSLERNLKKRHNHQYERKHSDSDASMDSSNAPSKFGKRTSRSEYDLSSKGKDPVPSALKEMDILLPNRGYTSSGQTSSHNRADRYNSDRHRTEITLGSERYNSSDRKNSEMTPGSDRHYTSDRIKTEMTQGSERYNTSDRNRSEVTPGSDRYSDTRSRNELTPGLSRGMIELQVTHEGSTTGTPQGYRPDRDRKPEVYIQSQTVWNDTASAEPSPIIQSPTKKTFNEPFSVTISGGTGDSTQGQCYSPREYEGSRGHSHARPQYTEHSVSAKHVESPHTVPQAMSSKIVTVGKMSPHVEVSKPFEMKDFYKYSEKLRRQRLVEQYHQALVGSSRSSTPSQHSSDGENHSTPSYHHSGSHGVPGTPSSSTYRGSSSSSPFGSPLSSRHMPSNNLYNSHSHSKGDHTNYGNSRTNSVSSSVTYGVNTTTSRVQYTVQSQTGRVVYKAQHQSSRQTYQPPTSMKCEPVRSMRDVHGASQETPTSSRPPKSGHHHQRQYSTPEKMLSPMNMSFNLPSPGSLSRAFSNEMLEWYDGDSNQSPTSV